MYIASASTTVKFHEFPSGNVTHNYQPGSKVEGPIRSISWSRDGNWLALVPYSGVTEIVSVRDQLKLVKSIQDIDEPTCAAFQNLTKKLIALGTKSGLVLIYDIKTRNTKKRFPRAPGIITNVDFTAKDTHCVAGCTNGDVLLYSNVTNNLSSTLRVPKSSSVTCLRTNLIKRNLIIGGSNEGIVAVWDSNVNKVKFFIEAHNAPVTSVAFSPVNSDLVVSTGADRQFGFYDIIDNKCIASVSVENNITAVDFSPGGTYFVMASQNGRVYIYDSRNIQEPVHSFEAHNSAIKHLAFQNSSEASDSSFCSFSADSAIPIPSSDETSKRNSELFGMFIQVPSNEMVDSIKTSGNSMEGGDSFILALGLDKNNTVDSFREEASITNEGVSKWQEIKDSPTTVNPTKTLHEKMGLGDSKQKFSSTPKLLPQGVKQCSAMSPIISFNQTTPATNVTIAEIQAAAKVAVKEELRASLDEIKADIKFQATHTTYQMKRMLLDLQMAMVKEFIKVENFCNNIKDDLPHDSTPQSDNNYLLEENEKLKKRVEYLEQQIAGLTLAQNCHNENISSS